jgi:hypothetical protein
MTPKSAWSAIEKYIPNDKIIWEAFYGTGSSGTYLTELGKKVIHKPIDFFENNEGDIVVSNPPFTLKKEILTRLKQLDKPFILIMPSSTINTQYVRKLFKNDLQILIPAKRIQFTKVVDGKEVITPGCNFDCFYFCYKMNLPRDIVMLD